MIEAKFPEWAAGLFQPTRYKVLYGGRGSGKSWAIARALLLNAASKTVRILCAREVQRSIRDSVHRLLSDQIEALGIGYAFEVLDNEIRGVNGSLIVFSGLSQHTVDSIKSYEGIDIVWVEEAQSVSKRSWDVLTPTIRKEGSEIWMSLNPELETDETYARFVIQERDDTWVQKANWSENPWFGGVLEKERAFAKLTMRTEDYQHTWEGECKPAVEGAIYFDQIAQAERDKRIRNVPRDPMLPVHRVWDLGFNDAMSIILVQRVVSELAIVGYVEDTGRTIGEYVSDFNGPQYSGWNWGCDFLPHDGFAKRHQTGRTDEEVMRALGCKVERTPNMEVEQGIRVARTVFPRVYFDKDKTKRLVECLKRYRRQIGVATQEPGAPLHDQYSHGADSFRYLCLDAELLRNESQKPLPKITRRFVV